MNAVELAARFRTDMSDVELPQLWSDVEVYQYMDEAQKYFARKTGGLADASSAATLLTVAQNTQTVVAIDKSILTIYDAYDTDLGRPVEIINYKDLTRAGRRIDSRMGNPQMIVTGMEPHSVRVYPAPQRDVVIRMLIDRLPLVQITAALNVENEDTGVTPVPQELEVDEQHHTNLLLWMKHLAYSKQDAETFDRSRAADFEQRFLVYCADATTEKARAMHKTRVVQYGGL